MPSRRIGARCARNGVGLYKPEGSSGLWEVFALWLKHRRGDEIVLNARESELILIFIDIAPA